LNNVCKTVAYFQPVTAMAFQIGASLTRSCMTGQDMEATA